ncbi:hypothetical protein ACFLQ9_00425 [Bacteroidota bacterium]
MIQLNAQTVEQIKSDRKQYLWGDGTGMTLKKADQEALAFLIGQISTSVESQFSWTIDENTGSTNTSSEYEIKENIKSIINTYSNATLHNTERIVISDEPDAHVLRYIKRSELHKVFEQRKNKIISFVSSALKAEKNIQIADALRYYSWAFTLLKSHPEGNDIYYRHDDGEDKLLITWLPAQMNNIFSQIRIAIFDIKNEDQMKTVILDIAHNKKPVVNFDYCYWDGRDWTNIISAKDGKGFLELYSPYADDLEKVKIKAEYIFEGEAGIDRELEMVMKNIDPLPFRNSYYTVELSITEEIFDDEEKKASSIPEAIDSEKYANYLKPVLYAIENKHYADAKQYFTETGFDMFQKLIAYGNAGIIAESDIKVFRINDKIMCRAVPMSFSFENNNRRFVEDIVFHFNEQDLIESITFGLSESAANSILLKEAWDEKDRIILVDFLEHFKTAYALKRINYIESIFADDALIITGYKLKVKPTVDNRYRNNEIIKYNRQTKQQYIKNLKYSFDSKEYINLKFEESETRKGGTGGNVYGIQIKQNYYSSNYGDVGYLFLMVDLNNPAEPIIHVRTWQPEKGLDSEVYGLSDF